MEKGKEEHVLKEQEAKTDESMDFATLLRKTRGVINWQIGTEKEPETIYKLKDNKYYIILKTPECRRELRSLWKYATPATIGNLLKALLEDENRIINETLFQMSRRKVVGFENGVFDLKRGCMREYSINDFVLQPIAYELPKTVDSKYEKTFEKIVEKWVGKESASWFIDALAYISFIHPNEEQVWFNFFGQGANGKSVVLDLLHALVGKDKVIGCDLKFLNRFSGAAFMNKWLVLGRDSGYEISSNATSFIKEFAGETTISVETKGGASFDVINIGKLIVSTNSLIKSTDKSYGWFRRILPIEFPNKFRVNPSFATNLLSNVPAIARILLERAYHYRQNTITLQEYLPGPIKDLRHSLQDYNDPISVFNNAYFFNYTQFGDEGHDEKNKGLKPKRELAIDAIYSLNGEHMQKVYEIYCGWHSSEYPGDKIEPSMNAFGGKYGLFLQSTIGKIYTWKKTNSGRKIFINEEKLNELKLDVECE